MKLGVIAITRSGRDLAEKIVRQMAGATLISKERDEKVADLLRHNWQAYDGFICIMATGIVVRSIAPLLGDKRTDPCVLVCDQEGDHVISLLSGHLGGGNALAIKVAATTGGQPVITTASDTMGLIALDIWARDNNLATPDKEALTRVTTQLVNKGALNCYTDLEVKSLPNGLVGCDDPDQAELIISHKTVYMSSAVQFYPRNLVVGTGCNRGTPAQEFEEALEELFSELNLSKHSIRNLASIDKKSDETGMLQFAASNSWTIDFFDKTTLNSQNNLEISFAALKAVGAIGVAEPASLVSAKSNLLLSRKRKWKNITMAVAQVPFTL